MDRVGDFFFFKTISAVTIVYWMMVCLCFWNPGSSPAFYLTDEKLNFVKVRCFSSLSQSGLEDVVKPCVLLALSNLQLRGQSTSPTPVVYAGDLTVFSTNPKEVHLQESLHQLRNLVQVQCWSPKPVKLLTCFTLFTYLKIPRLSKTGCSHSQGASCSEEIKIRIALAVIISRYRCKLWFLIILSFLLG